MNDFDDFGWLIYRACRWAQQRSEHDVTIMPCPERGVYEFYTPALPDDTHGSERTHMLPLPPSPRTDY